MIKITGWTEDGKRTLSGIFEMGDRFGLPLSVTLEFLPDHNAVVDWCAFIQSALKAGWSMETIEVRVREAVNDVYGKEYWNEFSPLFWTTLIHEGAV